MSFSSDEIERKQCLEFIDQIFKDSISGRASEVLLRVESEKVQVFFLVDGKYEKHMTIPISYWELVRYVLQADYFDDGAFKLIYRDTRYDFAWTEDTPGIIRLPVTRKEMPGYRRDHIEDIFRAFEDESWDAVKSIFLAILNMGLEQEQDEIRMELDGRVVDVGYFKNGIQRTNLTISSDSYDALARLIGENYLAFGFMIREFRAKEYLIRLRELNEDEVAPRVVLEIEELS